MVYFIRKFGLTGAPPVGWRTENGQCPCTFPDGSLGIFEAKGTTGKTTSLTQSLKEGKYQACALDAQSPIKFRVVVGTALGETNTRIVLLDPPSTSSGSEKNRRLVSLPNQPLPSSKAEPQKSPSQTKPSNRAKTTDG